MASISKLIPAAEAEQSRRPSDRRRIGRRSVKAIVAVSNASGSRATMDVEDLSTHGCSINGDAAWLRIGMILAIRLEDDAPVQSITRWIRGDAAGVEFFRPLSPEHGCWHQLLEDQGF
jgi:hypothetical protein